MFKIGLYEREITPLFGNNLCGYFNARPVSGVKDKTYAKAVVFENGEKLSAMLSVDACELSGAIISEIRERVAKFAPIPDENLLISATHSHTAAPGAIDPPASTKEIDEFYLKWLAMACADTVVCAYQRLEEATVKFTEAKIEGSTFVRNYLLKDGSSRTNPGVNNPNILRSLGEPDYTAPVFCFESSCGKKLGMIYSFGNHQDSVDGCEVSADWSGVVSKKMKETFGSEFISIFFLGTAGDVNQVDVHNTAPDYKPESCYKTLGENAYSAIMSALKNLKDIKGDISVINDYVSYETRVMTAEEEKAQKAILESVSLPEEVKLDACSPPEWFNACMAKRAVLNNKNAKHFREVRFQVFKIADVLIFALPGEVYTEYGKRIRAAFPENKCFFACLANNDWSYMPTKDRYLPGLYESLFGSAKFYPEDTEAIFDKFIELGQELIKK